MQPQYQTTLSCVFIVVSVLVSIAAVQGGFSFWSAPSSSSTSPISTTDTADVTRVLQNIHSTSIKFINKQIIPHFQKSSYKYLMMASYFGRTDVALPGFQKYFKDASDRELQNVNYVVNYLNKRGATPEFKDIEAPKSTSWSGGLGALGEAIDQEMESKRQILKLHDTAVKTYDPHLKYFVEDKLLDPKVSLIKQMGDYLTILENLKGDNYNLGEFIFDKDLKTDN